MRKWLFRLTALLILVALALALRATVFAPDPVPVRVFQVERGRVEETISNSKAGTVKARRRAKLSPGTSGIVIELDVSRGDRVAAGQKLLRLDDAIQRAELALTERALEVAQARNETSCIAAERALRELERNRKLAADKVVSVDLLDGLESAHDLAVSECGVAAAEVDRARAAVEVSRALLEKTVLVAPFDAVIAEVSIELGEWVTPSVPLLAAPELIDAIDSRSLYISAPMDEVDAALLRPGLPTRVTIDAFPDRSFPGKVARVAPYVLDLEEQNRTIEVEVELDDQEFSSTLVPGTSADVEVILSVRENVLRVPTFALIEGRSVLVAEGGEIEERTVETGTKNWDWTEILSGLDENVSIVTSLDRGDVTSGTPVVVEETRASP